MLILGPDLEKPVAEIYQLKNDLSLRETFFYPYYIIIVKKKTRVVSMKKIKSFVKKKDKKQKDISV